MTDTISTTPVEQYQPERGVSKMTDNDAWYLQCSFKSPKGTLINVRGRDGDELDFNLKVLRTMIADILDMEGELAPQQQGLPPALAQVGAYPAPQQYQQPQAPAFAQQAQQPANAPVCSHGMPAKYVQGGMSKTGRAYRAFWACALPREQQCNFRQDG